MKDHEFERRARQFSAEWEFAEWNVLVERLSAQRGSFDRFTVEEEIGRGGMGRVVRVRDENLHRELAMKIVAHEDELAPLEPATRPSTLTARFVEEAQIGGQLDHPGIVPVHDIGLDPTGRFYFTMKLVRGRTLEKALDLARNGAEGWSLTRMLNVLLRVCEAMSYAHARGVLHRDLKPANIMLGDHGEVYVMDWGLARLIGAPDRALPEGQSSESRLRSSRNSGSSSIESSPFVTEADRVVGTPAYMSPEQSAGASASLTGQSDIYSVGAILYTALTGRAPYSEPGRRIDNRAIWVALQQGPPAPITELNTGVAPELLSIAEKAMARTLADRYTTMHDLGEDLRAYLEMRVVKAHRTGPWHELKKWVVRNKAVAASLAAIVLVVGTAGFWIAKRERERVEQMTLQADAGEAARLVAAGSRFVSVAPSKIDEAARWLDRARALIGTRSRREAEQNALEAQAVGRVPREEDRAALVELRPLRSIVTEMEADMERLRAAVVDKADPESTERLRTAESIYPEELRRRKRMVADLEARLLREDKLIFDDSRTQEEYEARDALLSSIRQLEYREKRVGVRLEAARTLPEVSTSDVRLAWDEAIATIADRNSCPLYDGLVIRPQTGLVPLRRDPASGLFEFWHVLSGERPEAEGDGPWRIESNTGIVLVLIPGGEARAGAQSQAPDAQRFDPNASPREQVREARIDPFFIGKYELTQGQALWATDQYFSGVVPGQQAKETPRTTRRNPVESIDWYRASDLLDCIGLVFPTELQWEFAARANESERFGKSAEFEDVRTRMNYADASVARNSRSTASSPGEDGYYLHAAVGSFAPNGFGLHDEFGNVSEWCQDWFEDNLSSYPPRTGDGLVQPKLMTRKSVRGGSFLGASVDQRLSARRSFWPTDSRPDVGVRPARALER